MTHLELLKPSASATGRIVFVPHAGATSFSYYAIANRMPAGVECLGYDYPGHVTRPGEPLVPDIRALGKELADLIRARSSAPTVLFGHSMGSFVAYEATKSLLEQGATYVRLLIISAQRSPARPPTPPFLHEMDDARIVKQLRRMGGMPESLLRDASSLALLIPTLKVDAKACADYRSIDDKPLAIDLAVYQGATDQIPEEEFRDWSRLSSQQAQLRVFPGGHFYFQESPDLFLSELRKNVLAALG
jgi:medium-chain acyl-[acyl-carrier-protein] hydrolase